MLPIVFPLRYCIRFTPYCLIASDIGSRVSVNSSIFSKLLNSTADDDSESSIKREKLVPLHAGQLNSTQLNAASDLATTCLDRPDTEALG